MRPLIVNAFDMQGGAAIATYRLHRGLRGIGVDSTMLVQRKASDDATVVGPGSAFAKLAARARRFLDRIPARAYPCRDGTLFSPAVAPGDTARQIARIDPDVIHLSWVTDGFLRPESLAKLRKPLLWTLHDMWPFTGGCHYDNGCGRYRRACGSCPVLGSGRPDDLSSRVWARKWQAWEGLPITVVSPSEWLADCARASSLFSGRRIEVLPNGIDTVRFHPADKAAARDAHGLPRDRKLILFSAMNATGDPRKGFRHLHDALRKMAAQGWAERAELIVNGASCPPDGADLGITAHYLGQLHDEEAQARLYSAADVLVAPSVQENLSNSVMESIACGTPVVAFDTGGMRDMITHEANGYLARPFEPDDLARGIGWVLEDEARHATLALAARNHAVEHYRLETVAGAYRSLYEDVMAPK